MYIIHKKRLRYTAHLVKYNITQRNFILVCAFIIIFLVCDF